MVSPLSAMLLITFYYSERPLRFFCIPRVRRQDSGCELMYVELATRCAETEANLTYPDHTPSVSSAFPLKGPRSIELCSRRFNEVCDYFDHIDHASGAVYRLAQGASDQS